MLGCCDESGTQKGSRWWTYGAIWLPYDSLARFEAEAVKVRQRHNCWGEFKWNGLSHRVIGASAWLGVCSQGWAGRRLGRFAGPRGRLGWR